MPPVLPTERIPTPQQGGRLLRCGISIRSMSAQGHSRRLGVARESACLQIPDISGAQFTRREPLTDISCVRVAGVTEYSARDSLRLDVGRPDHLAPLLGFIGDELAEV